MKTMGLCLSLLAWASIAASSVAQEPAEAASARRLFLEIETAARLPSADQAGRLTRVN